MDTPLHQFRNACLDYLENPNESPLPSLKGLGPEDTQRAKRWLKHLLETREAWERVQALRDRFS